MVPVPFSDELRDASADIWDAAQTHPFLTGIGDGTLHPDRFRFYVRQDYLFLIDYGRLLALGCARAPRLELMERFADLTHSTLLTEMELHRGYAAEWGISREELERERPQPATRLHRLPPAHRGARRLRGAGGRPAAMHVGLQRGGAAPVSQLTPKRRALRPVDRDVCRRGVCRAGRVVPRGLRRGRPPRWSPDA